MHVPGHRARARLAPAFALAALAAIFTVIPSAARGATPASGTLTNTSGPLTYTAGPFAVANPTPVPVVDSGPECNPVQPCDEYQLTVSLPSGYTAAHPNDVVRITEGWTDTGSGQADYDLYVYKGTSRRPTARGAVQQWSGRPTGDRVHPGLRRDAHLYGHGRPVPADRRDGKCHDRARRGRRRRRWRRRRRHFGGATPTQPGVPRYQVLSPPEGSGANGSTGEFNIGFNPNTLNYMTNSWGDVFRVTPPEKRTPALPESGPAQWQDVSPSIASAHDARPDPRHRPVDRPHVRLELAPPARARCSRTPTTTARPGTETGSRHRTAASTTRRVGVGPYPATAGRPEPASIRTRSTTARRTSPRHVRASARRRRLQFGPASLRSTASPSAAACTATSRSRRTAPSTCRTRTAAASRAVAVSTDAGITWDEFARAGQRDEPERPVRRHRQEQHGVLLLHAARRLRRTSP